MSGGSFNYLENWFDRNGSPVDTIEDMTGRLKELLCAAHDRDFPVSLQSAFVRMEGLAEAAREFEAEFARLQPVMHAVEWQTSGDWGFDQMLEALDEWSRGERGA